MVRTHVIPKTAANSAALARAHVPGSSFYLLRPDGHIGLAGAGLDVAAATDYLGSNGMHVIREAQSGRVAA
jgi:hypothetical protein